MRLDELIEEIEAGTYDPQVSGDVVEFYCREQDYGVNPEPRRAGDLVDTGSKNPTYGTLLSEEETAFVDRPPVRRAMGAGWILANPVPTAIRTYEGEVTPRTNTRFQHVTNYRKRHGHAAHGVDPGTDVWEIDARWMVDVPEGYSVLYTHPVNQDRETFTTIPGILDADRFPYWFRVPVEVHVGEGSVQFGDPLVQLVPFERAEVPVDASIGVFGDEPPEPNAANSD